MSDRALLPLPLLLLLGEFIALGTLYNDMGIDWMEINCSRLPNGGTGPEGADQERADKYEFKLIIWEES